MNNNTTITGALKKPGVELVILEANFRVPFPAKEIVYLMKGVLKL